MKKLVTLLFFTGLAVASKAQYVIDSTFNSNGSNEFVELAGNIVNGQRFAYTANNDIIVAGRWNNQVTVWKYKQDGSLDNTFGLENDFNIDGLSYIPESFNDYTDVMDVTVQPDGKIVVLAESTFEDGNIASWQAWIVLARFLPDGKPDSTFNGTGLVYTKPQSGYEFRSRTMAIDENNQIYVGGFASVHGDYDCVSGPGIANWFIANFKENGSLDSTFNSVGYILSEASDLTQPAQATYPFAIVRDLKTLPNGKLLAAGSIHMVDSSYFSARFNSDGSYDNTYHSNGRSIQHIQNHQVANNELTYVKILPDESIVYHLENAGLEVSPGVIDSMDIFIDKVDAAGNLETTFGNNGSLIMHERAWTVKMTSDNQNRLVYSWYNNAPDGVQRVYFKRLMPNGMPDMTFAAGGFYVHEPLLNDPYANPSDLNDILFNDANTELTLLSLRSASYVPNNTFRLLNYFIDPNYSNLGTNELSENDGFSIYPNPTSGVLTFDLKSNAKSVLYDAIGNDVGTWELVEGTNTIQLSSALTEGVYYLKVMEDNQRITTKKIIYSN